MDAEAGGRGWVGKRQAGRLFRASCQDQGRVVQSWCPGRVSGVPAAAGCGQGQSRRQPFAGHLFRSSL